VRTRQHAATLDAVSFWKDDAPKIQEGKKWKDADQRERRPYLHSQSVMTHPFVFFVGSVKVILSEFTSSTQPCIPSGSLNRVPVSAVVKA